MEKKLSSLQESGIQELIQILLEQHGLILLFILTLMLLNLIVLKQEQCQVLLDQQDWDKPFIFNMKSGTDQINPNGTITTLTSSLQSFDFAVQTDKGMGEYFVSMRRFIPDFKTLTGKAKVTMGVKNYPSDSSSRLVPIVLLKFYLPLKNLILEQEEDMLV